jgi:hypothetical protein
MAVLFGAMGRGGLSQTPSADADGAPPKLRDMAMPSNRAIEYRHKAQECRLKAEAKATISSPATLADLKWRSSNIAALFNPPDNEVKP